VIDRDRIERLLGHAEGCVADLRRLADPDRVANDVVHQRFVLHSFQIAIQALIDVASHIVSGERLGEPETNQDLVDRLVAHGWLPADSQRPMHEMIGFRNLLVHGYARIDPEAVKAILRTRLGDFDAIVEAVRRKVSCVPPG
jgi:uncharacterized protein YutE (UPF0331/DUF86 family)